MRRGASFSGDRMYRYHLWRRWDDGPAMAVIGLNPSTADEDEDDPTIRRVLGFAKRDGFGAISMLNLYAFRATDPSVLKAEGYPIGDLNDVTIITICSQARTIVAAWGNSGPIDRASEVTAALLKLNKDIKVMCWGLTASGAPRHPLYLRSDASLIRYA